MMHCSGLTIMLQTLASLLIIEGVLSTIDHKQNGCYNSSVLLKCPLYKEPKLGLPSMDMKWRFDDKSTDKWRRLASIKRGIIRLFPVKTNLDGRFTVHSNGSLEITSLHPDDETLYQCIVMERGDRETHLIELRVTCGKVTTIKREVCVEEDVLLECEAKHRINPRKLKRVTWKKKTDSASTTSWSLVAASNDSSERVDEGFMLHGNGSLLLRGGRDQGDDTYKCDVTKTDGSDRETHFVRMANVKCQNEAPQPASVKTTKGRVAMTTGPAIDVVMKTSTRPASMVDVTTEGSAPTIEIGSVGRTEVPSTQSTMVCGGFLSDPVGTFQSPNFPSGYPANTYCKWTISVPQGYTAINITLGHVNLEHEKACQYDYVAVYDKLGNQVGCRHCGFYKNPFEFRVRGRLAVVVFRSDSSVEKIGFKGSYKSV